MILNMVPIPTSNRLGRRSDNDWDGFLITLNEAFDRGLAVAIDIPEGKKPALLAATTHQAMKTRKVSINTSVKGKTLVVWRNAEVS